MGLLVVVFILIGFLAIQGFLTSARRGRANISYRSMRDENAGLLSFSNVAMSRWANTRGEFDSTRSVDPDTILSLMNVVQSAPSGFNVQPYKCIVVQGGEARSKLAGAALGANSVKVLNSSFCVVFVADLESSRLLPRVRELAATTPIHGRLPRSYQPHN
jgi:nitroreductase